MIYLLKFGASFFLPPGIFFVILFYIAYKLLRRGEAKMSALLASVTLVFYLLSTQVVADELVRHLEGQYSPPETVKGDAIVMLGGGAMKDTPDIDGRGTLTSHAAGRILTTARLYHLIKKPVILSGGQVFADSGNEAQIAKRTLMGLGVLESDIIIENKSVNTTQNALYAAQIIKERGFKEPLLVTSAFHMPRSMLNFSRQGVAMIPYPADYQVNPTSTFHYTKLRPNPEKLLDSALVLQELLRTAVTRFLGV